MKYNKTAIKQLLEAVAVCTRQRVYHRAERGATNLQRTCILSQ